MAVNLSMGMNKILARKISSAGADLQSVPKSDLVLETVKRQKILCKVARITTEQKKSTDYNRAE
jgi:hypothetical protein